MVHKHVENIQDVLKRNATNAILLFSHVFWNRNDFIWTLYSYPQGILTVSILYISVFVPTDPPTHLAILVAHTGQA